MPAEQEFFVAVAPGAWGVGPTLEDAKAKCKSEGRQTATAFARVYGVQPESTEEKPTSPLKIGTVYVDWIGNICYPDWATYDRVTATGKPLKGGRAIRPRRES